LKDYVIRRAVRKDAKGFLSLLTGLADFEHLEPPDPAGRQRIINDVFTKKRVNLFLAFMGKNPVGYALYFYTYSTFLARPTLYLEDIFVLEKFRGFGIGLSLFTTCVNEAMKKNCGRLELAVLTWNKKAITFYEKLGAKRLDEWYYYRMTTDTLEKLRSSVQSQKQRTRLA
jgi:GNAT superfamily N-acetyltransferase